MRKVVLCCEEESIGAVFFIRAKQSKLHRSSTLPLPSTHPCTLASQGDDPSPLPDLQLRFVSGLGTSPDGVSSYRDIGRSGAPPSGLTLQCVAIRPRSRGHVTLTSPDPTHPPTIHPNYLGEEEDARTLREGIRLARRIASQPALARLIKKEVWPGEGVTSDGEIDHYVTDTLHSANGLAGTCKMGEADDPMGVVDERLRVRGVEGVRVVDASVLPAMPGGQLGATVFALAERGAQLIREGN